MPYTVTSARDIQNVAFGTKGARALIFPGRVVLILGSHADCDEVIKAAVAAKDDMPVDHWPSLYGPALAAGNEPTLAGDPGGAA